MNEKSKNLVNQIHINSLNRVVKFLIKKNIYFVDIFYYFSEYLYILNQFNKILIELFIRKNLLISIRTKLFFIHS